MGGVSKIIKYCSTSFMDDSLGYRKLVKTFHVTSECETLYISVDGLHKNLSGQVIVTINPLALLYTLTDQDRKTSFS
jgi:hypothetical protein